MKTFKDFIVEAPTEAQAAQMAPAMAPEKIRAALEKNARRQAAKDTPANNPKPQAALPPGKTGGGIEKAASAIVKSPSSAITKPEQKSSAIVKTKTQPQTNNNKTYSNQERVAKNRGRHRSDEDRKRREAKQKQIDDSKAEKEAEKRAKEAEQKAKKDREKRDKVLNVVKDLASKATQGDGREPGVSKSGDLAGPQRRTSSRM